jgi:hypothetical protein
VSKPGFQVQARTTIDRYYSYIEAVAVQIHDTVLQVEATQPDSLLLNGSRIFFTEKAVYQDDKSIDKSILKGSSPSLSFRSGNTTSRYVFECSRSNSKKRVYRLDLSEWSYVRFQMYKEFMTISIHASPHDDFEGAVGLLGHYPGGQYVGRDGLYSDSMVLWSSFPDYALEWQVDPVRGDVLLFDHARPPQMPYEICRLPTQSRPDRRQLLRGSISMVEATEACRRQGVSPDNIDLCKDDILSTQDLDLALIW